MFREAVLLVDVQESLTPRRTLDFVCWVFSFCGVLNDSRVCSCCVTVSFRAQWWAEKTADRSIVPFGVVPVCWLKPDLWLASSWRRMMVETSSFSAGCSDSSSPVGSEVQLRWKKLLMINTVKIFLIHTLKIRLWYFICSNYISDAMDKNDVYSYVGNITSSSFLTVAPFFDAKSPSEADVAFVPGSSRCCVS